MNTHLAHMIPIRMQGRKTVFRNFLFVCAALAMGLIVARLIVEGHWQIAAMLIFSAPAFFILQKHPFLSIVVWLLLTPFLLRSSVASDSFRQVFWVIHRFLPLLTVVAIVLPSALGLNRSPLPRLGFPEWMMAGYITISIASILLANKEPLPTLYLFYDRNISPMLLYLVMRLSKPDERMFKRLIPVLFFIALSQSAIGIISWFAPSVLPKHWVDYESHRTIGTMINAYAYVTTLIMSSYMVLHYGLQSSSTRIRNAAIVTFLISIYAILICFSRSGWLAAIISMIGIIAIYPRFMLRLILIGLPLFMIVAGIFLQDQIKWARERLYSEQAENSALSRMPVYLAATKMFASKPLTGWGYGNFDYYDRQFQLYKFLNITKYNEKDHASHNFFLTICAEQGLFGISFFLAPMLYWLRISFKRFNQFPVQGYWGRGILVIFWMVITSHVITYSFTNTRIVFTLGVFWLTIGMIARFIDSHPVALSESLPMTVLHQGEIHTIRTEAGVSL